MLIEADAKAVDQATAVLDELSTLAHCADPKALLSELPWPEDQARRERIAAAEAVLSKVAAATVAGRFDQADALLDGVTAEVETLAYPPLTASALSQRVQLLIALDRPPEAVPLLEQVYALALEFHMPKVGAGAAIQIMSLVGTKFGHAEDGRNWILHAQALTRAVDDLGLESSLRAMIARLDATEGKHEQAIAGFLAALRLIASEDSSDSKRRRTFIFSALAVSYQRLNRYEEALDLYVQSQQIFEELYGPRHPNVANVLINQGLVATRLGDHAAAEAHYQAALEIRREVFGPNDPKVAAVLMTLGILATDTGDYAKARLHLEPGLAIYEAKLGPQDPKLGQMHHNYGEALRFTGEYDEARRSYERAVELLTADGVAGYPLTGLGQLELSLNRPEAAVAPLEAALASFEQNPSHPMQMGETHFALARALAASGRDPSRALELGAQARRAYAEAKQPVEAELAAIEAWLRERDPPEPARSPSSRASAR